MDYADRVNLILFIRSYSDCESIYMNQRDLHSVWLRRNKGEGRSFYKIFLFRSIFWMGGEKIMGGVGENLSSLNLAPLQYCENFEGREFKTLQTHRLNYPYLCFEI